MRTTSADLHTLTGAYAVNALSDLERTAFEAHLTRCQSCAIEVTELAATAARLGVAVESPPPPQLRARVLAAAAETRQLSPHTARVPDPRRKRWAGGLLAAACLVAAVFVTVDYSQSDQERQLAQLSSEYSRFSDFLSTPDAKLINGRAPNGATGTAVVSASRDEALFLAKDLPQAPNGHAYQIWLIGADGPHPAGLLDSRSSPVVVSGLTGAQEVALTVEPSGGSKAPTTPKVMAMSLV
ncbi:anti-sigma factor [Lentzea flaviverrucosa]|uniref:Regulator of SigK n=1 Tax=Lentzea flaviverrucosa TaxID=200379 RepID=A0A1H9VVQ8_9PSEU|nr:anti-sigma factor [Lentzea flaviverrucosa]RDI23598.1 anti-sigma-K factor rskA [Lentzea flaviverrucosa]SES25745.1 Anti-sigma-K factor rskA [Lentzea flaviverrucosa]